MGNVYVKKASGGPASLVSDLAQSILGGTKQDVIDDAAKRQLANFDYSRGATPLYGDKDAGSLGPKDRHGNQQWIPANAAGRHDMDMEGKLATAAARGIPFSRLISGGLGALSAIDSLANAQPGQSGLGMLHNAATRGYLSHLGAKSFLDPMATRGFARLGRGKLERENPHDLPGAPPRLTMHPTVVNAMNRRQLNMAGTGQKYLPEDVEYVPQEDDSPFAVSLRMSPFTQTADTPTTYTHGMIPNVATPESHTIAPDIRELIENRRAIDGTGVMEQQQNMSPELQTMSPELQTQYAYLRDFDTNPVASPSGNQAGATPSPSDYTPDMHQRLIDEYGG